LLVLTLVLVTFLYSVITSFLYVTTANIENLKLQVGTLTKEQVVGTLTKEQVVGTLTKEQVVGTLTKEQVEVTDQGEILAQLIHVIFSNLNAMFYLVRRHTFNKSHL